jgi:hypothetical protein
MTNGQPDSQSVMESGTRLGPITSFLLLPDSCRFVDMVCPLWQEDGSTVYNCSWALPEQPFLGLSSTWLDTFYCLKFETPQTWKTTCLYLYPQDRVAQLCQALGFTHSTHSGSGPCQNQSYLMTDSQSASPAWCQASIWDLQPISLSLIWKLSWRLQFFQ